jgi:hypothetical protein
MPQLLPWLAFLLFQTQPSKPSPVPGLLLILSIIGAIIDWRYLRRGGTRPSKRDKITFFSAAGAVVLLLVVLGMLGSDPEALGGAMVNIAVLLFALWEVGRWRMRRKYPLPRLTR